MYKRLSCSVVVSSYRLAGIISLELNSSWDSLTDTCKISLPSKIWHKGKFTDLAASELIKRGDIVRVQLGYNEAVEPEFSGFVAKVNVGSPLVIDCEDAAFLLKKGSITRSFRSVKLKELLEQISPLPLGVVADVSLGQFRISNATPAQILEELQKTYGLVSFVQNDELYSGVPYPKIGKIHKFIYGNNIIEEKSELYYRRANEIKLKIRAISIMPDNSKHEIEIGDPEGEIRILNFYNIPKIDLEKLAEQEAEKLRFDGFQGRLETFGYPSVRHGDIAFIKDPRSGFFGNYLIKGVTKVFGATGFRQTIQIDRES